jgi:hypothetical protein
MAAQAKGRNSERDRIRALETYYNNLELDPHAMKELG